MRIDESKSLNPGLLRHRVTWQRKSVTGQNSYGEDIWEWQDIVTVSCQVKPLTGRETQDAQQRWAEAKYKIVQHWYAGMELVDRGAWWYDGAMRYLDILDIQDRAGILRVMDITAKEWVGVDPPVSPVEDGLLFDDAPGNFDDMGGTFDTPEVP
jgi:head-tail adaptor